MRFLADESCDRAIVRAMQDAGHDVTSVRDTMRGATDQSVLNRAFREHRVELTEDKDFGELVFGGAAPALGIVLLRYPAAARARVVHRVIDFARRTNVYGSFVVIEPSRVRVKTLVR